LSDFSKSVAEICFGARSPRSEAVEIVMIADAIPQPTVRPFKTHGSIVLGDPHRPRRGSSGNWLEVKTRMSGVRTPKLICLVSGPFDVGWQGMV